MRIAMFFCLMLTCALGSARAADKDFSVSAQTDKPVYRRRGDKVTVTVTVSNISMREQCVQIQELMQSSLRLFDSKGRQCKLLPKEEGEVVDVDGQEEVFLRPGEEIKYYWRGRILEVCEEQCRAEVFLQEKVYQQECIVMLTSDNLEERYHKKWQLKGAGKYHYEVTFVASKSHATECGCSFSAKGEFELAD